MEGATEGCGECCENVVKMLFKCCSNLVHILCFFYGSFCLHSIDTPSTHCQTPNQTPLPSPIGGCGTVVGIL